jgi:hypothetical protein
MSPQSDIGSGSTTDALFDAILRRLDSIEATLQSMKRHLAGVGGDGDGVQGAEGGDSKPSVEGNNFFCAGCGNLCSRVRSALGEPDVLVCSGDILHVDDSPRALHTDDDSGACGAGEILGGGGDNIVAGGSRGTLIRGVNHLDTDDVVLHSGGIDRALAQEPGKTSADMDGAPGGGSSDPDAISGGISFSIAGVGCSACDLGGVGSILAEPSRGEGIESSRHEPKEQSQATPPEPSRAGFDDCFLDRTLTPLLIQSGQRNTAKLVLGKTVLEESGNVGLGASALGGTLRACIMAPFLSPGGGFDVQDRRGDTIGGAGGASGGGVGLGADILADGPSGLGAGVPRDVAGGLNSEPPSDLQSSPTPARSLQHCRARMCGLSDGEADHERPSRGNLNASVLGAVGTCSGRGRDSDDAHGGSSGMIPVTRSAGGDALDRGSRDAENSGRGLPTSSGNDVWGTGNNDNIVILIGDPLGVHDDIPLGQHGGGRQSAGIGKPAAHGGNTLNASGRLPSCWPHSLAGQLDTPLLCNDKDDCNNHFDSPG